MTTVTWSSVIIALSLALTGCGGGDTTPLSINNFAGTTNNCSSGETISNTGGCIPNTGDTSTEIASIITSGNYINLATKVTKRLDNINSARPTSNSPIHLADLLVDIARESLSPDTINPCLQESTPTTGQTIIELLSCPVGNGVIVEGQVNIVSVTGNPNDFEANISINNLIYTSANQRITFDSANNNILLALSTTSGTSNSLTRITLGSADTTSLLNITEGNLNIAGIWLDEPTEAFNNVFISSTLNINQVYSLDQIKAQLFDSTTSQSLNIYGVTDEPLIWTLNASNPYLGQLRISTIDNTAGLTLSSALDGGEMQIQLDDASATATTNW